RDQASTYPGAVDLEGVDLAAELSLHTRPILVPLEGARIVDLHAGVEAETAEVDHRPRSRTARLQVHQDEEMVVEVAGATDEARNLRRRPTLDGLKRGDAALTLPVALCNHQIVAVTGRDRLEGDLLNLGGLVHDSLPAEAAGSEGNRPIPVLEDRGLEGVHVLHPIGHAQTWRHDGPPSFVDATVVAYGRDRHAQR